MILNSFKKRNFGSKATGTPVPPAHKQPEFFLSDTPPSELSPVPQVQAYPRSARETESVFTGKLSPTEIYKKAKNAVWVLLSLNVKYGQPDFDDVVQGSAIAVSPATLLTNCHTLKGHSVHLIAHRHAARAQSDHRQRYRLRQAGYERDTLPTDDRAHLGRSSGGGLFDCAGRLMGITAFYVDGQNLNFAIAADEFR